VRRDAGAWVVPSMVERCRAEWGLYHWSEYDQFARDQGITIIYHERGDLPLAFHHDRTVFVRRSRSKRQTARRIWHEMSHIVAFPLNFLFWESLDWGELVISKTERRNDDFMRLFPIWDDGAHFS
jgi:hypothetical protein